MAVIDQSSYGQLFWWRESPHLHTLITIWGYPLSVESQIENFLLTFKLFDTSGNLQKTWEQSLSAQECLFLDSAHCLPTQNIEITEGVLALVITTKTAEPIELYPAKLGSIIDWYSTDGELVSLHSDQLMEPNRSPVKWTEIVVQETSTSQNSLVIMNGFESQPPRSISLEIKNHLGKTSEAVFTPEMLPFSLHRLHLNALFPNILDFAQDQPITITGTFTSYGLFTRPYVVSTGKYFGAYHAGNRYSWNNLSAISYKFMGQGEVNPMLVVHRDDLTTTVNLLNTHAELEKDFWVDASLYDCEGCLIIERQHWLLARRNQLSQGEIVDLLPDSHTPFVGHLALRFSADQHAEYPGRLQALMEYSTAESTAKVMAWSGVWNWQERVRFAPVVNYVAYYRVWCRSPFISYVSLTNCGIDADYDRSVDYCLRLENGRGEYLVYEGSIPSQGTVYQSIHELFPTIADFLGDQPVGLVVVETTADIASMHLTWHQLSGVYAAEHFLPTHTLHEDNLYMPCGS